MSNQKKESFVEIHPVVFPVAASIILLFVLWGCLSPSSVEKTFENIQSFIVDKFSWFYILSMSGFLVFAVWLAMSRFGTIRLGPEGEKPEFNTLTWFAMLFSAGMGIGLLFWGVAEPLTHYNSPPIGRDGSLDAARNAMGLTVFHWGLHPWALYSIVALALAYFGFRRGLPLSFRSVFFPLIGEKIHGRLGDFIDVLAVVATLFGVATSLGLGAMQVNAGLNLLVGVPQGVWVQVMLIAGITAMATCSVVTGLDKGIRRLSEANMTMALLLLIFIFLAGPTVFLLNTFVENIGTYLQKLPSNSFWTATFEKEHRQEWLGSWTVFYWGWWMAWSPFVGMFIARVSKGRTIREFIAGVLLAPTFVGIIWLTVFGGASIHQDLYEEDYNLKEYPVQVQHEDYGLPITKDGSLVGPNGILLTEKDGKLVTKKKGKEVELKEEGLFSENVVYQDSSGEEHFQGEYKADVMSLTVAEYLQKPILNESHTGTVDTISTAMFITLQQYPLFTVTAFIGTLCIVLFFVTSSDSASMVIDIISSGGNQDPPVGTRLFWAITEGLVAIVLLLAGGLQALQTASITAALPFCFVIILMCFSLTQGLFREYFGDIPEDHKEYIAGDIKKLRDDIYRDYHPEEG